MDRTPNAYFFVFIYMSGMAHYVSKTNLSGLGRFSISLHLCFLARVALVVDGRLFQDLLSGIRTWTPIHFYPLCRPIQFLDWAYWLTVNADVFSRNGLMSREEDGVFFLSELTESFSKSSLLCNNCMVEIISICVIVRFFELSQGGEVRECTCHLWQTLSSCA